MIENDSLETKDLSVTLKVDALNFEIPDSETDHVDHIYKGYRDIILPADYIDQIFQGGLPLDGLTGYDIAPNEFFCIESADCHAHGILAKFDEDKIVPLKYRSKKVWGLTPRNKEQRMAFELLMDEKIHFVTISGGTGTDKSILSVAVALQKTIEENVYDKIILVKPGVTAEDSFGDAIENLVTDKSSSKVESFLAEYQAAGMIEMKTFADMRGTTLSNAIVIIDQAQEVTPHLAKRMLRGAGQDSKIIMLSDSSNNQIENMKTHTLTGHMSLEEVDRSTFV